MKAGFKDAFPWIVAVAVMSIWAETFVSSKVLLSEGLKPAEIFFYRFSLAYLLMWALSHRRLFSFSVADEIRFLIMGLSGGSLYFLAENTALQYSTASNTAILVGTAPLMTALATSVLVKGAEKTNLRQVLGSVIAFAGMALVILNGKFILKLSPVGDFLAIMAAALWAVYSITFRDMSCRYDTSFITRKVFFYGLVTILVYFLIAEPLRPDPAVLSKPSVWGNLLYLSIVATFLCFRLWNWVLRRLGTVRPTNLVYSQCFVTMTISHFVLGEHISWMAAAGAAILVCGMFLTLRK